MLSLLSVTYSCIEVAKNIDLPESTPKLVVQSYLSPSDSAVALILSWSKPTNGIAATEEYKYETNAVVKIIDGSNEYILNYNPTYKCYFTTQNQVNIIPGKEYKLSVEVPNNQKIYASCTIPTLPNIKVELISFDSSATEWGEMQYIKKFRYTNLSTNENNKYFVFTRIGKSLDYNTNDTITIYGYNDIEKIEKGKSITFSYYDYSYNDSPYNTRFPDDSIIVYQVDESYYRYHLSLYNNTDGDPFAEPSITYSNVQNGLGVFCAYNKKLFPVLK